MRNLSAFFLPLAAAVALAGCKTVTPTGKPPVAVVQNILSGGEEQLRAALDAYTPTVYSDINIVDSPERAAMLTEALITADRFDNIDASARPDQLPDFAGERIVSQMDITRGDYSQLDTVTLREVGVRSVIAAIDTRLCASSGDTEYRSSKPSTKLVIVSSAELEAAAAYDIDTLKASLGIALPVIYPARLMLSDLIGRGARSIAVVVNGLTALSGAYEAMCAELSPEGQPVDCFVVSSDDLPLSSPLSGLLRSYSEAGNTQPMDAVLLDCFEFTPDDILSEYAGLLLNDGEESLAARKSVSSVLHVQSLPETVSEEVFRLMREKNIFTHDIRYPVAAAYLTNPEMFQYALMQFDWNSLPGGLESDIMSVAPKTYISYVQDSYIPGRN